MDEFIKLNIQRLMDKKGWSQQTLADNSGVSRQTIHNILDTSSTEYDPKFSTLYSISQAVDVDIPTLFSRFEIGMDSEPDILPRAEYISILRGNLTLFIRGKKQNQVSIDPGLSESAISKLLNDDDYNPRLSTIQCISSITGKSVEKLFVRGE